MGVRITVAAAMVTTPVIPISIHRRHRGITLDPLVEAEVETDRSNIRNAETVLPNDIGKDVFSFHNGVTSLPDGALGFEVGHCRRSSMQHRVLTPEVSIVVVFKSIRYLVGRMDSMVVVVVMLTVTDDR